MKEYNGKPKSLLGLGIAMVVLSAVILVILLTMGFAGFPAVLIAFVLLIISFLYKGMVVKITIDDEKIIIYRPLIKKTIKFSNIAFCMVHGIDESSSIMYAFVKRRIGNKTRVRGIKQNLSFEEVVKQIHESQENIDLDINFNMAEKIPVAFVENTEDVKADILNRLGGYQKKILSNI